MNKTYLDTYLQIIKPQSLGLSETVNKTATSVYNLIKKEFDYKSNLIGLLLGNVQSGKTAQMLGIISKLADEQFELFIILTSDNVYLQNQTLLRTTDSLIDFNVYSEDDDVSFLKNKVSKPLVIILKKNTNVLRRWRNLLSSSAYCSGRSIVIIDDEADAASLNTMVNKSKISTINKHLTAIKELSTSSIYIQVTATPQAILLQSNISGFKPSFIYYFEPGDSYIGGDFIYSNPKSYCIEFTEPDELDHVKEEENFIPNGLKTALLSYLVVCGHFYLSKVSTCNFLVHPSVRISDHDDFSRTLGEHLNLLLISINDEADKKWFESDLREQWINLQKTQPDIEYFDDILNIVIRLIEEEKINIIKLNSKSDKNINYHNGYNIIVGGNSLGRGVTFQKLQTVYYCRKSKTPQADTYWQHSRMFGYDRVKGLLRVFIPETLHILFSELNASNKILIDQISRYELEKIQLIYPDKIRPTRPNVLDKKALNLLVGGVNFFSPNPDQTNVIVLDKLLQDNDEDEKYEQVDVTHLITLLKHLKDDNPIDWDNKKFSHSLAALSLKRPSTKYALILRKDRNIAKGTGTLLSPSDRKIGDTLKDWAVLTLYRVNGTKDKYWNGNPFYIANIKFPTGVCLYDTIDL